MLTHLIMLRFFKGASNAHPPTPQWEVQPDETDTWDQLVDKTDLWVTSDDEINNWS